MMNRRQFVGTGAAGAMLFARVPKALAAIYDLVIKGGRVIDPSAGGDAVRDVAIAGGRIAGVGADIAGDATETIDARGKIVTPGLIDIHTHAGRSKDGPPMCLQDGVTGWVDAGTGGADNIDQVAAVARGAPQIGRALVNIARTGVAPGGELHDINNASVAWRKGQSHAIAMSSSASRRAFRTTSPAPTTSRHCGARGRRLRRSICRS
jgi:dihydroorotase